MTTHTLILALFFIWLFPTLGLAAPGKDKKYSAALNFGASGITIALFYGFIWAVYVLAKYLFW
jgi:hypothetical protein